MATVKGAAHPAMSRGRYAVGAIGISTAAGKPRSELTVHMSGSWTWKLLAGRNQISHYGSNGSWGPSMKNMSAKNAKNEFGSLLVTARAEPVTNEKHLVAVVISVEEYDRLLRFTKDSGYTAPGITNKSGK
jgi:hypothetical protein